jgi:DNA-binding PadR family transcriptional regulator
MVYVTTIYLPDALAFERKPPKLKFDILEILALRGRCSKTGLKNELKHSHYPDISHSVDDLKHGEYIRCADKKSGRGKVQVYYAITQKGLKALLYYDNFNPIRFWEILHGYCQNSDEIVTFDKIDELYQNLVMRVLNYSVHGFTFQLDNFDYLCNNWLQREIVSSNHITPLQKVIEILASYRKITFEKLLEKIDEPKKRVKEILHKYSYTSIPEESLPFGMPNQVSTDFLIQNIIITNQDTAKPTYELSLFGVMLCLVLIRYNDMDRVKGGLYFKQFSFEEYYDLIASNYKEKLPLIFGKWNQLKGILKVFTLYNFDIILDREIRSSNKDLPSVRRGGNKELIEGIREIILDNRKSMSDFRDVGWKVLDKYIMMQLLPEAVNRPDFKRVISLCDRFKELVTLLDPPRSVSHTPLRTMMGFIQGTRGILKNMEESFADEIAAFYYTFMMTQILE